MSNELAELLDTAILRAGLSKTEILMLEEKFKKIYDIKFFLENVYNDSDQIVSFSMKFLSYQYLNYYINKDKEQTKVLRAKKILDNQDSNYQKLINFAKKCYSNKHEQALFLSQYIE